MKTFLCTLLVCIITCSHAVFAADNLDFTLHKLESGRAGNTILVVGGIQGDEPGGFNAAALLVTHYKITKGNVWVVPNLNFISIIKRCRGFYGDLNRKFAAVRTTDPEYATVRKIQSIIEDDQVDMVLNLHDGSGFYRPSYVDRMHNPRRWGQCIIIDQATLDIERYGNLEEIAQDVVAEVNKHLFSPEHVYHVKNTCTHKGNKEMEKTLTYYAIRNGKSSFGLEVSKSFPTHKRSYYHLRALESFMDKLGIEYERRFELTERGTRSAINSNINVAMYDNRIFLDVGNARNRLGYIPMKKNAAVDFTPSNPLVTIVGTGSNYRVFYGNRRLTRIHPQYFDYDTSIDTITMLVDGYERDVDFGGVVSVGDAFEVKPRDGYRVNVIGFTRPGVVNESGISICRNEIKKRFSVDKSGHTFRVEVYRDKKFSGMVLVDFRQKVAGLDTPKPAKVSMAEMHRPTKIR